MTSTKILPVFWILFLIFITFLPATTYIAATAQEIQNYTNMLVAGDTLLVQSGTYNMNWNISDRYGVSNDWITIQAMSIGAVINGVNYDNVIDIYDCHYVELKGFEITNSYAGSGIDGIKFRTSSDHMRMEDLTIHDITGVGISANPSGQIWSYLIIRHCHIWNITDVGEGLYIGNHDGLSAVDHCLVELNWIHDCHPHKGIQFKRGTYLNVIRDNVVYDCDEAGIVLYKTDQTSPADNNIVKGNVIWNAPEGIFAVGQTNIDNNVIFNCDYGINVRNYSGWGMNDLYVRNNTIYHCAVTCLRLDDWNTAGSEMVSINNACFQDSLSMSAVQVPDGPGPGIILNNRHYGQSQTSGSTLGKPPSQEFINPGATPGNVDLYPLSSSSLRDSGVSTYGAPVDDFNLKNRPCNAIWDVGAYEWSQNTNPGWPIYEDFKEIDYGIEESQNQEIAARLVQGSIFTNQYVFQSLPVCAMIRIYDVLGRTIHRSCPVKSGRHCWQTRNAPSGLYFYAITDKNGRIIRRGKIALIR